MRARVVEDGHGRRRGTVACRTIDGGFGVTLDFEGRVWPNRGMVMRDLAPESAAWALPRSHALSAARHTLEFRFMPWSLPVEGCDQAWSEDESAPPDRLYGLWRDDGTLIGYAGVQGGAARWYGPTPPSQGDFGQLAYISHTPSPPVDWQQVSRWSWPAVYH